LWSFCKKVNLNTPSKYKPKIIIIDPPIFPRIEITLSEIVASIVEISTPKIANTSAKPKTKNILLSSILRLLLVESDSFSPDIYAINPGIIGRIHGLKNEINPAKNAMSSDGTVIR
jgi:hypothetical protein